MMVTRDQALAAAQQILAATAADKAQADRHGGDPALDSAHDAALDLARLVADTRKAA
ncbi:hypothetical protein ACFVZH_02630 [Streptomyces sp. NPDC059534]|uniref:hypothetical protein n=1 Tax=Streptomyces sp. NPDC059534 TaxID=3346859 RepID=UPI0036C92E68